LIDNGLRDYCVIIYEFTIVPSCSAKNSETDKKGICMSENKIPDSFKDQSGPPVVLLVDDEPKILDSLSRVLRKEPYTILTAQSGVEALALMEKGTVHVMISDMRMPHMTGAELLLQVKKNYPDTIRMVLSGESDLEQIFLAINDGGIYKYISKPASDIELKVAINKGLEFYSIRADRNHYFQELNEKNKLLELMNNRLETILAERTRSLNIRDSILEFLVSSHSLKDNLDFVLEQTARATGLERMVVYALQEGTREITPVSAFGLVSKGEMSGRADLEAFAPIANADRELVKEALSGQNTVLLDVKSLAHSLSEARQKTLQAPEVSLTPLIQNEICIGLLEINNPYSGTPLSQAKAPLSDFLNLLIIGLSDHFAETGVVNLEENVTAALKVLDV
jgi:CheY-like chemotaxis protein